MIIITKFKLRLLLVLFSIAALNTVFAQNGTVKGFVKDKDGSFLNGASVTALASPFKSSTVTGTDGIF